jgi:hypothetical protein
MPSAFEFGAGKIVDSQDRLSAEADVVVYSRSILPPLLYSDRDGVFPVEATFLSVEVKSRLTASEVEDAIRKAERLRELDYISGVYSDQHQGVAHELVPAIQSIFAFESDMVGKSELERYAEKDPDWLANPKVRSVCVVGRGFWWFDPARCGWLEHPATEERDEVVEFLALASNSLINSLQKRGRPRFGQSVFGDRPIHLITMPFDTT